MEELIQKSLVFVGPVMAPIFVMMLAPLLKKRARTVLSALMGLVVLGFLGDLVVDDHSHLLQLDVPTVFGRGADSELFVWTAETVTARAWHWHIVAAAYFALAGLLAFAGRNREPKVPQPVVAAVLMFAIALATRLTLEKTACHVGIVWALGTSTAGFVISVFFGFYAGARGLSFGRFFKTLFLANLLQRLLLCAVGYVMTLQNLGTHLDVTVVTDIAPPGIGEIVIESPTQGWLYGILMPQMTFALVMSTIVGVVLGALPYWLGRRRAKAVVAPRIGARGAN